jgi:8-oxo-dGTP pyrophosphatase MutT (NUDIX family)|tara:strand:+ start:4370 stop:4825 length:456 start_codon:yes stop_codon:yes gene_type:complete
MSLTKKWLKFLTEGELKTVGIVVCLNDKQQFLIIRRSNIDSRAGQWTMPGGHIDEEDNSIEAGAIRELEEEANLSCKISDLKYLDKPSKNKYYYLTTNWTGEVNVNKPNPHTGDIEHDDYKWVTIEEIKDIDNTKIPIYLLEKALEMSKNE